MKNIYLFIITIFGLLIIGCNPLEDINNELDTIGDENYTSDTFIFAREIAPEAYTLVDEDYELSSNESVSKYKNFSGDVLPKDYLPEILIKKFTAPDAAEMIVTYNYYSKPIPSDDLYQIYTISDDEYSEMGQDYIGFASEDEADFLIAKLLDLKVYASEAGAEKTVGYNEYIKSQTRYIQLNADGSTVVLEDSVQSYILDSADYESVGANYYNFTFVEDAEEVLMTIATAHGHVLPMNYSVFVYRNFFPTYKVFYHTGTNWLAKQSLMAVSEPLNFALDKVDVTKSYWWADPAIKITLGGDDYALYSETSKYSNFDVTSGGTPGTNRAKLVEMVAGMLEANHEPIIDEQQYLVFYAYYDGSSGTGSIRLIRTAGVWSEFDEE
ncbi:MAG: hypothetical protein JEZ09_10575 [Salinivirgaceae bacterium]|nr:hypothetical protein [Salinivirgaceae bacterium]